MMIDDYGSENGLPSIVRRRIIFGWEIGTTNRKILQTYQLHSQKYLGPTAMDAEMVLLMANQAQGADIDIRVVCDGRSPDCNVWSNFKQVFDAIIWDPPYGVRAGGRKSGGIRPEGKGMLVKHKGKATNDVYFSPITALQANKRLRMFP
ncbi:tRNA (guanine(10)-N2)-methyltransferase homolog [Olea europaea subsp. europaea]|uniref:tRNA (Guanine(10)-N2)-methyltransferase homolog n=1 Tax=Olea europaea subsp. europaea TaxID=158383 RepID=A0A8S0P855_OLEEU|nr:tRNA (guanine(10)-N2)-methyltransferase homolog [Olea europaea subsp. europaea]